MRHPHRIALAIAGALVATSVAQVGEPVRSRPRPIAEDAKVPEVSGVPEAHETQPPEALLPERSRPGAGFSRDGRAPDLRAGRRERAVATIEATRDRRAGSSVLAVEPLRSWQRPYFDPVAVAPASVSVAVTGVDPLGPRALALWRVSGDTPVRIAETRSDFRQRFDFGQVLVPSGGLTVAVTAAGRELGRPAASDLLFLELDLSEQER